MYLSSISGEINGVLEKEIILDPLTINSHIHVLLIHQECKNTLSSLAAAVPLVRFKNKSQASVSGAVCWGCELIDLNSSSCLINF